jgi:hypothetical protein
MTISFISTLFFGIVAGGMFDVEVLIFEHSLLQPPFFSFLIRVITITITITIVVYNDFIHFDPFFGIVAGGMFDVEVLIFEHSLLQPPFCSFLICIITITIVVYDDFIHFDPFIWYCRWRHV